MNRERAKELLPIIQAFAEGKTVQCFVDDYWQDMDNECLWQWNVEYRIKPQPREFWLRRYESMPKGEKPKLAYQVRLLRSEPRLRQGRNINRRKQ